MSEHVITHLAGEPEPAYNIHKAAALIIEEGKVLLMRAEDKAMFMPPGGKLEGDETVKQACVRESEEELGIAVDEDALTLIGVYFAQAAGNSGKMLKMSAFMVSGYTGTPRPNGETAELAWIGATLPRDKTYGSIFEFAIHPMLKGKGLLR